MPDFEGVARHAKFARVSRFAALRRALSPLASSFRGLPDRGLFENLSLPVLDLIREMIFVTVDFIRFSRRVISEYDFLALYHVHTDTRYIIIVSQRRVIRSKDIFLIRKRVGWEKRRWEAGYISSSRLKRR